MTLAAEFCRELTAVKGRAAQFPTPGVLRHHLIALLMEMGIRSAVCWDHPGLEALDLRTVLAEASVTRLDASSDPLGERAGGEAVRSAAAMADAGITWTDLAIANTGTLVLCSKPGQGRLTSLLPPLHIAIVPEPCLVADLPAALARLGAMQPVPAAVHFITGPSRSADIEQQMILGVHGPGKVVALVLAGS